MEKYKNLKKGTKDGLVITMTLILLKQLIHFQGKIC